jgi:photosystem II stability/assembly factor-like uncharacterized protein
MKTFYLIFIFFILIIGKTYSQIWESVNPSPEFFPWQAEIPDTIHLRGTYGRFVTFSNDAGVSWDTINMRKDLYSCSFVSANKGWVSADSGRIFRTNDGCQTWDTIFISTSIPFKVDFINNLDGFAYLLNSHSDSMYISNDGGTNWILKPMGLTITSVWDRILFIDTQHGWSINNGDSVIKVTQNGSLSWNFINLPHPVYSAVLFFLDSLNGWLAGGNDSLLRTSDGGFTWQCISSQRCNYSMSFKDALNGICIYSNKIYITSDGGVNWTMQILDYDYQWCTISQGRYYAIGYGAVYSDDGINWNALAYKNFPDYNSFFYIFNPPRLEFQDAATGIYLSGDEQTGMAFFTNYVYLTEDSGKNWKNITDIFPLCSDIQMVNDSLWYFSEYSMGAGHSGFYKSHDHFQTRILINDSIVPQTFYFTDSLHGVCGGSYTSDGGITWSVNDTNNLGGDYSFIDSQNGWSVGGNFVGRTYDGGISWTRIFSSLPASSGSGDMVRIQFADSLSGIIFKTPWGVGTTLFKSVDGGFNWQQISPQFNFTSAYFTDSIHGWLAGQDGIFYTSDGGITFQQQSNKDVAMITFIDSIHGYCEGAGIFLKTNQLGIIDNINTNLALKHEVNLFPNPNNGYFTLQSKESNSIYKIYDNLGRELLSGKILNNETKINFSSFPNGIYFSVIISDNRLETKSFIKN